jgi:hypothetical protein
MIVASSLYSCSDNLLCFSNQLTWPIHIFIRWIWAKFIFLKFNSFVSLPINSITHFSFLSNTPPESWKRFFENQLRFYIKPTNKVFSDSFKKLSNKRTNSEVGPDLIFRSYHLVYQGRRQRKTRACPAP